MNDNQANKSDNSFVMIWHYEGRDIPFTVVGPPPEQEDEWVEAIADFIWKNRHQHVALDGQIEDRYQEAMKKVDL